MGFFDDFDFSPVEEEFDDEPETEVPEWLGPPRDWLGGVVPLELLLARSERAAVFVTRMVAYPTGFNFLLQASMRSLPADLDAGGEPRVRGRPRGRGGAPEPPPALLRHGLEFSDGRKAAVQEDWVPGLNFAPSDLDEEEPPDPEKDLILTSGEGEGSDRYLEVEYWVWPLPPPGPLAFVCEWPPLDIPERRVEVDAEVILGAAARAQAIWPDSG